jgi:hypothetical protein
MTERQRLKVAARKYGATIDWSCINRIIDVNVDAPHRKIWANGAGHTLVGTVRNYDPEWITSMVDNLIRDMADGLADCLDPDCDVCTEE